MKKNPFVPWGVPETIINRKEEQKLIESFLQQIEKEQSWALWLHGPRGMGKGLLLNLIQKSANKKGFLSCFIIGDKIQNKKNLIREIKIEIDGIIRLHGIEKRITKNILTDEEENIKNIIKNIKEKIEKKPLLIIIKDFDKITNYKELLRDIEETIATVSGFGVVMSSLKRISPPIGSVMIELKPVSEDDYREYIEKMTKTTIKMGEECIKIVYKESGGCPKLLQFITWYLYDNARETDKIITQAHYISSRLAIISLLAKEWFSSTYYSASEAEKKVLRELARYEEINVTELAKILGWKEGPTATILMRLVERGDIIKVKRGTYRLFAPLYRAFIMER
ncbi:MAG: AAA family ATPase [Candidatus Bilamarchaeaceae archaeon]